MTYRKRTMLPLLIASAALLTTCAGSPEPKVVTETTTRVPMSPKALTECPEMPKPPAGIERQSEAARYMLDLYESGATCERCLEALARWLEAKRDDGE